MGIDLDFMGVHLDLRGIDLGAMGFTWELRYDRFVKINHVVTMVGYDDTM